MLAASLFVLVAACRQAGSPGAETVEADVARSLLAAGLHSWTTADGNAMPYEVSGNTAASVTVVMIHGWMCNRSYWEAQLPPLATRYRTVTIDLPGHGEATADRERWTYAAFGEDVAGLIEGLGLQDVVLIGHSAGGPVALDVASRAAEVVLGIVAVDSLQDADFELSHEQAEVSVAPFEQDFVETCAGFMLGMFREDDDPAVKQRVVEASCRAERARAGAALIRDYLGMDWPSLFRRAGVPVWAINSTMFPTNVEGNRRYADFEAVIIENAGHFLHMTRPEEFNRHLLEVITSIVER